MHTRINGLTTDISYGFGNTARLTQAGGTYENSNATNKGFQ
jgi:hypothetical protein